MYVLFQKIWTMPLSWEVFYFELPHPYGSSRLAPYCPSKIFAFNPPPPPSWDLYSPSMGWAWIFPRTALYTVVGN